MTQKEKGATPCESAPHTDTRNSTRETSRETEGERGLYLPLAWAQLGNPVKPPRFRGKTKRKSRADAIRAKRYLGEIDSTLAGLIALATVATAVLMTGGL